MKKFAMSAFAVCAIAGAASAAQLTVSSIGMGSFDPDGTGSTGSGQGGFFNMTVANNSGSGPLLGGDLSAVGNTFKTWCIERTETISNGTHNYGVSAQSILGGASPNEPNPLTFQAAYLYATYRSGGINDLAGLGGFDVEGANIGSEENRRAMQIAFWHFQGQIGTLGLSGTLATTVTALIDAANAAVADNSIWGNTLGNVRVLNMGGAITSASGVTYANGALQDLMVIIPLPQGVGLASAGLLVLGARRRRGL